MRLVGQPKRNQVRLSAAAPFTTTVLAAPGPGLRYRIFVWSGSAGGGALSIQETVSTTILRVAAPTGGRPFFDGDTNGIVVAAANEGIDLVAGGTGSANLNLTYWIEAAP